MVFGQVVVGYAGSGKTTYVHAAASYLRALGRDVCVVNVDPAAEENSRKQQEETGEAHARTFDVDVRHLIRADDAAREHKLGPNGALIYAADYLCANSDWLVEKLRPFVARNCYFLFDCPGQLELFQSRDSLRGALEAVTKALSVRWCCLHLTDSHLCADGFKYVSALLCTLSAMLFFDAPHVCAISKCDLVDASMRREMDMPFRFYRGGARGDLTRLADAMEYRHKGLRGTHLAQLTRNLLELADDYGLVSFASLAVEDTRKLARVVALCDRSVGYVPASDAEGGGGGVSAASLVAGEDSDDDDDDDDDDDLFDDD